MPDTTVIHHESWTLRITPGDGDDPWPVTDVEHSRTGAQYQPDLISVTLTRGAKWPDITVSGFKLRKDGSPAQNRAHKHFWSHQDVPDWIAGIIEGQRVSNGLAPGTTGTGW